MNAALARFAASSIDWRTPLRGCASPVDRAAFPAYRALAAMAATTIALALALDFHLDSVDLPLIAAMQAALVALAMLMRWRGMERLATGLEAMVLVFAATMGVACLSVLLATTALPYRDDLLVRLDAAAGLDWRTMFAALHDRDRVVAAMSIVYTSLLWQPFLLVVLLASAGRRLEVYRFIHGWCLALVACAAVFPLVPANGPYVHYGLSPSDIPALDVSIGWRAAEVIDAIRSGALRTLSPARMTGMISVPSFHAAGSVLLFWSFRHVPIVGPLFMALDVAMCCTAPLIGSHYFVDIACGIAVAVLVIVAAEARPAIRSPSAAASPAGRPLRPACPS